MSATSIDFDIRIFKAGTGMYLVTAQSPGTGQATGMLDWPKLSDPNFVSLLERIRDEPYTTKLADYQEAGGVLFAALFNGQIRDLFIRIYGERVQAEEDTYLRLRIDIQDVAPEVARLPWEFMRSNDVFLGTQVKTLVTRNYLNLETGNIKPLQVKQPKILVVIPRGSGLKVEKEEANIRQALDAGGILYDVLAGKVTVQQMDDILAKGEHNILHFIGHGEFEKDTDTEAVHGTLRFNSTRPIEDEKEDAEWVLDVVLRNLFGAHERLKLVVLNACHGAETDAVSKEQEKRSGPGFIGAAPALLRAGIPAVVAMQYAIRDDVAIRFSQTFYERLTSGRWAGYVDAAVTEARKACFTGFSDNRGFATPILYLRSPDGKIFDIPEAIPTAAPTPKPAPPPPPAFECPPATQPAEDLLAAYKFDTAKELWSRMQISIKSLDTKRDLHNRLQAQLDLLRLANPGGAVVIEMQIKALQTEIDTSQEALETQSQVLAWLLYTECQKQQANQADLDALLAKPQRNLVENRRVSELKKALSDYKELAQQATPYLREQGLLA